MSPRALMSLAFAVLVAALAATAVAATADSSRSGKSRGSLPTSYSIPGDRVFPEGIARAPRGPAFFVGSTTDGTIFRGDVREPAMQVLSPGGTDGRTTAIGMKADRDGRLIVAGGGTGKVFVLDAQHGRTLATLQAATGPGATFINDVALAGDGVAYATDSQRPVLYRVTLGDTPTVEPFIDFTGTAFAYQPGFNANGIVAAKGGRVLLVVQSNTGKVFRIDTATKAVEQVDVGGVALTNGDGLVLRGRTLYVVRNQQELVVPVKLSEDMRSGRVKAGRTSDHLRYPTTAARDRDRLLLVNSQFDRRSAGAAPDLPFTVDALRLGNGESKKARRDGKRGR